MYVLLKVDLREESITYGLDTLSFDSSEEYLTIL